MIHRVRHTLRRHAALPEGAPLWVAVSGGVDSMVLWHVLRQLGHPCHVVHVDHGLRGPESDADRELVMAHGRATGTEVHVHRADVRARAAAPGMSVQMAARELRYQAFRACVAQGPPLLATAHHADDASETFLLHLLRGIGARGWGGIPPVAGPFVRPLIECRRSAIEAHARAHAIPFRSDPSNAHAHYLRSRVRHELLPLMEGLRPGAADVMVRNVGLAREMAALAVEAMRPAEDAFRPDRHGVSRLPVRMLLDSAAPHFMLHALLGPKGFHPDVLEQLLRATEQRRTGAVFMQGPWRATVDRDALVLAPAGTDEREWTIASADAVPDDAPLRIGPCAGDHAPGAPGPHVACLDPAQVAFPLVLRPWRPGDRMRPAGMHGSKLISDILTDAKVPAHRKRRAMVLESAGRVLWLCGHRLAEGAGAGGGAHLRLEWAGDGPP